MGTLKVTIAVGDSQGRQFEKLDVTVDTGSTYTAVPRADAQQDGGSRSKGRHLPRLPTAESSPST